MAAATMELTTLDEVQLHLQRVPRLFCQHPIEPQTAKGGLHVVSVTWPHPEQTVSAHIELTLDGMDRNPKRFVLRVDQNGTAVGYWGVHVYESATLRYPMDLHCYLGETVSVQLMPLDNPPPSFTVQDGSVLLSSVQ